MSSNALAVSSNGADLAPFIDDEKLALIRRQICPTATEPELEMFIALARAKRLDPLTNQIYLVKYGSQKAAMFASIDGLRLIAKRAGDYGGQTQPYWCGPDKVWTDVWLDEKPPVAAKVGVYIKGSDHPTWGVAHWKSYAFERNGNPKGNNWKSMPEVMLAKCSEAIALRKAFPDDLSGLYVREEFPDASGATESRAKPFPESHPDERHFQAGGVAYAHSLSSAEVVDADTGEIETPEQIAADIKEAREALGWTAVNVQSEADSEGINLRKVEGLAQMRDRLQSLVTAAYAQPTIIDAEVVAPGEPGNDARTR